MDNFINTAKINVHPSKIIDGINIYDREDYNEWFETEYISKAEPWYYSHRAAELYRHEYSVKKIRLYNPAPQTLLELGCSKGLMTEMLIPFSHNIYAADISLTALKACKQRCTAKAAESNCQINYYLTTTPKLPFEEGSFDVVTICDGLAAWYLPDNERRLALNNIWRVLKKGCIAILTDCLMPEQNKGEFDDYEALVRNSQLSIVEVSFLYDKPWYMLESGLKKIGIERRFDKILTNLSLAKTLNNMGQLIGRRASRHIVIIGRKD